MRKYTYFHTYYGEPSYKESPLKKVKKVGLELGTLLVVAYVPFVLTRKVAQCIALKKEGIFQ